LIAITCVSFSKGHRDAMKSGALLPIIGAVFSVLPAIAEVDPRAAIWIEGEAATRKNVTDHPWYGRQVKFDVLSGGAWLSHFDDNKEGSAEYDFDVLTADNYTFWVRANPLLAKLEWQIDGNPWQDVNFSADQRGNQNIASDNKPDLRFIAWAKVGQIRLDARRHTLRFKFSSANSHHGGVDCFVFTRVSFSPQGTLQPGANQGKGAPDEWFPLIADDDPCPTESIIDMSGIIEAPAGRHGRVIAKGKDLVFDDAPAKPIKLWGCNANLEFGKYSRAQLAQRAKYLRKFGINLVRDHPLWDDITSDGNIDPGKLDAYDWWFAELKKNGICSQWSVFYHVPVTHEQMSEAGLDELFAELPALSTDGRLRDTYGLATAELGYLQFRLPAVKSLLQHVNPHTRLRYADDPALAVVEMQNEDSIFFWNPLGKLSEGKAWPHHSQRLRRAFFNWTMLRYGSEDALKSAWGKLMPGDSFEKRELDLAGPWEMAADGPRGKWAGLTKRAGDYTRFLTEHQNAIFHAWEQVIRASGFKGVTVTTNWLAGSPAHEPANILTDCTGDMIDRHNYAGGGAGVHNVTEGGVYAESHLGAPGAHLFMIGLKQVEDKPFSLSEWTMGPPNEWKLECAPLLAFYGMGLQGWDASAHFAQTGSRLGDGWPGMRTYATDTPHYIGQFPALAFALHKNHITEASIVAARRLTEDDVFSGRAPLKQDYYDGNQLRRVEGGTPLEVFAIGRATIKIGSGGKSEQIDFSKFWDREKRVIRSTTGELSWDYGNQLVTVQAPKTQAIIGRAAGRKIELPGVTAEVTTPFISLIFTPLDDELLRASKRILITALARDKQAGARYSADGTRLEAVGSAPLLLEPVQATLRFHGAKPVRIRALDCYGAPVKNSVVPIQKDGAFIIDGTYRAYYYEVSR
jgi:hypothetical protein